MYTYVYYHVQAPSGSCLLDTDKLLIADTLNHKIKCIEVDGTRSAKIKTFVGSGKMGNNINVKNDILDKNGKIQKIDILKNIDLNSPQGVAYDRKNRIIYIADTGNNRILSINRDTSSVSEIIFDFSKI
jgi:DNA-binding beta-propeller fold protein YncE